MTVVNVHIRDLAATLDACAALIDELASERDRLWPSRWWPPMRLDRPLGVGARGGHGPIRYHVVAFEAGRLVRFAFSAPRGFHGGHEFRLAAVEPARTQMTHVLTLAPHGLARLTWPLLYSPLHDALIEDALSEAEAFVIDVPPPIPRWPWTVRLLRRLARLALSR